MFFAQGAMRSAFLLQFLESGEDIPWITEHIRHGNGLFVAKQYQFLDEQTKSNCEADFATQKLCMEWAEKFNAAVSKKGTAKKIKYLPSAVMRVKNNSVANVNELISIATSTLLSIFTTAMNEQKCDKHNSKKSALEANKDTYYFIEPFLIGNYQKWSNNSAYMNLANNTPHAFTHYIYEKKGKHKIPVDLQGVLDGDTYYLTDPQIHSKHKVWKPWTWTLFSGNSFGAGNLGEEGIDTWLSLHVCNPICKALHLKPLSQQTEGTKNTIHISGIIENATKVIKRK
ncbi:Eukaryotic elongation factor 2 kinase [Balamuthia mandrillaris]